jgi:hypothetical protein
MFATNTARHFSNPSPTFAMWMMFYAVIHAHWTTVGFTSMFATFWCDLNIGAETLAEC